MRTALLISMLALAIAASPGNATAAGETKGTTGQRGTTDKDTMDARTFVEKAARESMLEIQLGQLAQRKATSNDVKQFGQRMVTDHTKANDDLKRLTTQKNIAFPTDLGDEYRKDVDRLTALSGAAFDRAYMEYMVSDHDKAIRLFEQYLRTVQDPELKTWTTNTLAVLRQHLEHARDVQNRVKGSAAR